MMTIRYFDCNQICEMLGISRAHFHTKIKRMDGFPNPLKLSHRTVLYDGEELAKFMNSFKPSELNSN